MEHVDQMIPLGRSPKTMQLDDRSDGLHFTALVDTRMSHAHDVCSASSAAT
jgi:hypothetical protein